MQRQFSAGGVVFRKSQIQNSKSQIMWMVAKSNPNKDFPKEVWRLPKGWLDDEENGKKPGLLARGIKKVDEVEIQNAALREVKEEAGVNAKIIKKIGTERYFFTDKGKRVLKFVTFYLLEWLSDLSEAFGFETEEVKWLSYRMARNKLTNTGEKKILDKAKMVLDTGLQESLV